MIICFECKDAFAEFCTMYTDTDTAEQQTFGSHTYLFDELQLDWNDNSDWNWNVIDYDDRSQYHRFNTRCTAILPLIHQHICMHIDHDNDAQIFFKQANEDQIDKLYASAYITYEGDNLLIDEVSDDDDDDDILERFDEALYAMIDDTMAMDEWFDESDNSQWIVSDDAVSSFYDYQWQNDAIWDEIDNEIVSNSGNRLDRKCLHMWGNRLCLCQFLGWMDSKKYKCLPTTQHIFMPSKRMNDIHQLEYKHYDDTKPLIKKKKV